jgi:hypothetical protein
MTLVLALDLIVASWWGWLNNYLLGEIACVDAGLRDLCECEGIDMQFLLRFLKKLFSVRVR